MMDTESLQCYSELLKKITLQNFNFLDCIKNLETYFQRNVSNIFILPIEN